MAGWVTFSQEIVVVVVTGATVVKLLGFIRFLESRLSPDELALEEGVSGAAVTLETRWLLLLFSVV